jgi:hypothetical protein
VFLLVGGVLLLLSGLVMAMVTGPTLYTDEFDQKGFGDNWTRRETLVFFLLVLLAGARARYWLPGVFMAGSLLMACGMAVLTHASPPATLLAVGIALLASGVLWWLYFLRWRVRRWPRQRAAPPIPARLRLNTPYTVGKVTITVRALRKRQAFRPVVPPGYHPPLTWFMEFGCLLHNSARADATIWTQLEEIVPETEQPRVPYLLYQFPALSDDETADRDFLGTCTWPTSRRRYTMVVHDRVDSKLFFRFEDTRPMHLVAFTLHVGRRNKMPWENQLFTVEV